MLQFKKCDLLVSNNSKAFSWLSSYRTRMQTQELRIGSKYALNLVKKCERHNNAQGTRSFSRLIFRIQNNTPAFYPLNRAQLRMSRRTSTCDDHSSLAQTQAYSSLHTPSLAKARHKCFAGSTQLGTSTCPEPQPEFSCGLYFWYLFSRAKRQTIRSEASNYC